MTTVIEVEGVSKKFKIHHERHQSLKERLLHPRSGSTEVFEALQDINFTVGEGETLGIVGHNGSGKSTLLKCICGVLKPTTGEIRLRGSLAALLELGAGFQTELSGRDNIYLYGAMLGFSRRMVDGIFDDVVAFSEIEQFIDTQVKFYSSGMYVRLAFAVAVNVDPDILVVDEVLAVGDERFQAKCVDRIKRFQQEGRTILLVTHNADQVRALCDRAVVLDSGEMIADGPTRDSLRIFREHLMTDAVEHDPSHLLGTIHIESVSTPSGSFEVKSGAGLHFDVAVTAQTAYSGNFVMELFTRTGLLVSRSDAQGSPVNLLPGRNVVGVDLGQIPLLDGVYDLNVGIVDPRGHNVIAWSERAASIQVTYDGREGGLVELDASIRQQ
ncbi:MAG TPA: polysaccharide ABC transporter ATP-binding protein [Acidimicrobiales bacterium]|jgi:ABC-2 type transport system ATP-binding protein|nr:polysaccharide ABC transporter ATP-binding protein [Acidimicrobiales bacterium]